MDFYIHIWRTGLVSSWMISSMGFQATQQCTGYIVPLLISINEGFRDPLVRKSSRPSRHVGFIGFASVPTTRCFVMMTVLELL